MGIKLRKIVLSTLLAGLAAVVLAPSAEARRPEPPPTEPSYVPPPTYGEDPELDPDPSPFENNPVNTTVLPVTLVADPGAGDQGSGEKASPVPDPTPTIAPVVIGGELATNPEAVDPTRGGILSRTGAETMPLARAGLAALSLGGGFVVLGRRRRRDTASA